MEQQLRLPIWQPKQDLPRLHYWQARQAFIDEGWKFLGDGACAAAFLSPLDDRVIKVCGGDAGARATIEAALANPDNPHLPKIGWFADLSGGGFAVECERLDKAPGDAFQDWSSSRCPGRRRGATSVAIDGPDDPMKAALLALQRAASDAESDGSCHLIWDTHQGNLMVRPSTGELVLNDCLYDAGDSYDTYAYRSDYERCSCGGCTECRHLRGSTTCGYSDCYQCHSQVDRLLPVTMPVEWAEPRCDWQLRDRIAEIVQANRHAAGRHCGLAYCAECQPAELALAA